MNNTSTADRLRAFLADEANVTMRGPSVFDMGNGFRDTVMRRHFQCSNGITVSIQQGATHYCNKIENTFEMWNCPHLPMLQPYGSGEDGPYAHVPFDVVVQYIDAIESDPNFNRKEN